MITRRCLLLAVFALAACAPAAPAAPTAGLLPTAPAPSPSATADVPSPAPPTEPPTESPPADSAPTVPESSPTPPCSDDLTFLADLTVPDDSVFAPGQPIDKRWSVQNTGTCDWNGDYRLIFTSGDPLGAPGEVALFPARSGASVELALSFTAPAVPGEYVSRWQARNPAGNLFGATVFIKIQVAEVGVGTPTYLPAP